MRKKYFYILLRGAGEAAELSVLVGNSLQQVAENQPNPCTIITRGYTTLQIETSK